MKNSKEILYSKCDEVYQNLEKERTIDERLNN